MADQSLVSMVFKKALGPLRNLGRPFSEFWNDTPKITYTEEKALLPDPHIDIFEDNKEFHITAYVPGLEKNDIHIELNKGMLSLRGAKKIEKEEVLSNYHVIEHASVYFNHTVHLPTGINENDVEATLKDGILDIALSKLSRARPKDNSNKISTTKD